MIALSFVAFFFGIVVGIAAAVVIHSNSHPGCPGNRKDEP